ncbi:MAG: tail fiber domain-containing protein [Bacteroidota bacterium]
MKPFTVTLLMLLFIGNLPAQNGKIGIGTNSPKARLHVTDSSVLFSADGAAPVTPGNPPSIINGRMFLWYADKGAFRSGYFNYTQLLKDSIGKYSFAMGEGAMAIEKNSVSLGFLTRARGLNSVAMGDGSVAEGESALAMGYHAIASGETSFAIGKYTIASGNSSIAMGNGTVASGPLSVAFNYGTKAIGEYSAAFNFNSRATGANATAMGLNSIASGNSSTTMGEGTWATSNGETAVGTYNLSYEGGQRIFTVGIGTSNDSRKNAMTILKSGYVGIGTVNPDVTLSVNGYASKMGGGTWMTFSDARVKKNITDYNPGLKEILAIRPVNFQYNSLSGYTDSNKLFVGVIAQEIEKILPASVTVIHTDSLVKDKRIFDGSELTYTLINAIKEQQFMLEKLNVELLAIRNQLNMAGGRNDKNVNSKLRQ